MGDRKSIGQVLHEFRRLSDAFPAAWRGEWGLND
jgi:hypothetical protein